MISKKQTMRKIFLKTKDEIKCPPLVKRVYVNRIYLCKTEFNAVTNYNLVAG